MSTVDLTPAEFITLARLKEGGGCVASRDPEKANAEYSRLWDLGYVDDLGTQQALTDAGREALRLQNSQRDGDSNG